jgi:hypothetical protein
MQLPLVLLCCRLRLSCCYLLQLLLLLLFLWCLPLLPAAVPTRVQRTQQAALASMPARHTAAACCSQLPLLLQPC